MAESSKSAALGLTAVMRKMHAEGQRLWKALEQEARLRHEQEARLQQLEVVVRTMHEEQVKSAPCPLPTQCLFPAAVKAEEWLKQNFAPFKDPFQVVQIPVLCLRWDHSQDASTSQPGQPDNVDEWVQQYVRGPIAFHEPLEVVEVVESTREFCVLAADVGQKKRLAALVMYQGVHKNTLVKAPCKLYSGSSSSAAAVRPDKEAQFSDEELLVGTGLVHALSD